MVILETLQENGTANLYVNPAKVYIQERDCLDYSEQGLFNFLFTEELVGECVSLQDLFIVNCQRDQTDVIELAVYYGVD